MISPVRFAVVQTLLLVGILTALGVGRGWAPAETAGVVLQFSLSTGAFFYIYAGRALAGVRFVNRVLAATIIKLSVGVVFLFVALKFFAPKARSFAIVYLGAYFLFTFFEVYALMRNLRRDTTLKP
ncbi:MAG: hypothetical protein RMM53_09440 [Bacteroidia bacterium]|nr:hypothetical protein [Bacteroidia bacterium]MDW8334424.1 hypothetical protein [Bacteroidia bacterium]